jgi:IS4 transposase
MRKIDLMNIEINFFGVISFYTISDRINVFYFLIFFLIISCFKFSIIIISYFVFIIISEFFKIFIIFFYFL